MARTQRGGRENMDAREQIEGVGSARRQWWPARVERTQRGGREMKARTSSERVPGLSKTQTFKTFFLKKK